MASYTIEQVWSDGTTVVEEQPSGFDTRNDEVIWDRDYAFVYVDLRGSGCEDSIALHRVTGNDTMALPMDGRSVSVGDVAGVDGLFGLTEAEAHALQLDEQSWELRYAGRWCDSEACTSEPGSVTVTVDTSSVDLSTLELEPATDANDLCAFPPFP